MLAAGPAGAGQATGPGARGRTSPGAREGRVGGPPQGPGAGGAVPAVTWSDPAVSGVCIVAGEGCHGEARGRDQAPVGPCGDILASSRVKAGDAR